MTLLDKKNCDLCGRTFRPTRTDQRFHSEKCRKQSENARRRTAPISRPVATLVAASKPPDVWERAANATVALSHGLKKLAEELNLPEAVAKAEAAMDKFAEAFDLVDQGLGMTEAALANQGP
jgi:predicted nucleic acid-binding Zn ribbon protein